MTDADVVDSFHDELVNATAHDLPERFFDRFVFNLHRMDARGPCVLLGAGIYPPKDTVDGFVVLVDGDEQRNLRFSSVLSATDRSSVGPFSWTVLRPMTSWRLALGPNPIGLEFELTWQARTPAWTGRVDVDSAGSSTASFDHLFQSGRYSGWLQVDGERMTVDGWYGQRDRSRGVRTMTGGQALHLWFQAQFPDRSIGLLYVEDRAHRQLLLEGAVMHEDGRLDPVVEVTHELSFDDGLDLRGGRVRVRTAGGASYLVEAEASRGGGFMAGAGYGGQHGVPAGRDHVEHDVFPLGGVTRPRDLDSALTDRLTALRWGEERGSGIFEFAHTRSSSYTYRPTFVA